MKYSRIFYKRKWFKAASIIFGGIFFILLAIDLYVRGLPISTCEANKEAIEIKCPFLSIAKPSTDNVVAFIKDVKKAGMSPAMAVIATLQVGIGQKGIWAVLLGSAPDIQKLENVHGISHCDRYNRYTSDVERLLKERAIEEQVTLQDLVEVKKWIAAQEGVEVNGASKQETALVFGYAGGNLETQKVFTKDVMLLINGKNPSRGGKMNIELFNTAQKLAHWE
ncbi:MAG: hypothetical protein AAF705_14780 [Bacteroidota bacterium]